MKPPNVCDEFRHIIKDSKFIIMNEQNPFNDDNYNEWLHPRCVIDFRHPDMPQDFVPALHFWSSMSYYPQFRGGDDLLETTIRSPVMLNTRKNKDTEYRKFQGKDYCCEDGENVCMPHTAVHEHPAGVIDFATFSVEARFNKGHTGLKFKKILKEML